MSSLACNSVFVPTIPPFGFSGADVSFGPTDCVPNVKAPSFAGSQEPYADNEFADGVYALLPLSGVVVWNSHASNLTDTASTLDQFLNLIF